MKISRCQRLKKLIVLRAASVLSRNGFIAAQGQEILRAPDRFAHPPEQRLKVFAVLHKIDLRGVDDQQVRRRVVKKEMLVSLHYFLEIILADRFLPRSILLFQPFLQHLWRCLQINHQIGRRNILPEHLVVTVVNLQLSIAEIQAGKQLVFLEDVVGNDCTIAIALHIEGRELLITRNQEGKLRLKSRAALTFVKAVEEGVVLGLAYSLRV